MVVAGGLILLTGIHWIDPIVSLVICAIIASTWGLLKDSLGMSLAAVPPGIDPPEIRAYLERLPGVVELHDLHIWPVSTTDTALICHLVMPGGHPGDAFSQGHGARTRTAVRDRPFDDTDRDQQRNSMRTCAGRGHVSYGRRRQCDECHGYY